MKTVFCRKYQKDLPKMDRAPFQGEKGEEIFSSVSKQAWMEWLQQQTMLVNCLLYTSPSPRDGLLSRMPSSA